MKGLRECVIEYAKKRGISKAQAETEFKDALSVIADACVEGGVSFKGLFTIKKRIKKGRSGSFNGKDWKSEDKATLSITVGNELSLEMNK